MSNRQQKRQAKRANNAGLHVAPPPIPGLPPGMPPTMTHFMAISAYTDRPPEVQCSGDMEVALRLMSAAAASLANAIKADRLAKEAEPVEDRERKLMGPREE